MWQAVIFVSMLAMTKYYSVATEVATPRVTSATSVDPVASAGSANSTELATSMAVYREAVLAYLHSHPDFHEQAVPDDLVRDTLPSWYVMPRGKSSHSLWAHCVSPDGMVVVYANDSPPVNITKAIVKISKHAVTVGESLGNNYYYAPVKDHGQANATTASSQGYNSSPLVPLPECAKIAAGRPIWLGNSH